MFPFLVVVAALAALASIISACAVIFGTNPTRDKAHNFIYKGGLILGSILLAASIGTATWIFFI